MGFGKWIVGALGWAMFGPIGGILGYFFTSRLEKLAEASTVYGEEQTWNQGQRNSFLMSLLILSTAVIKADGKTTSEEMARLREFFARKFGAQAAGARAISATSSCGLDQFSVENAYTVRYFTPNFHASSQILRTVLLPWEWPTLRGIPRFFAHLPFPSIISAICCGTFSISYSYKQKRGSLRFSSLRLNRDPLCPFVFITFYVQMSNVFLYKPNP